MNSPAPGDGTPVLTDDAITEAAAAVREFERAGISPPRRLVAIARHHRVTSSAPVHTAAPRAVRH